jgi:hypothetical protein
MRLPVEATGEKFELRPATAPAVSLAVKQAVGYWHGGSLSFLRRMCLASQVKLGYDVTLFSYDPVDNLPPGVVNKDAEAIIPQAFKQKLQRIGSRIDVYRGNVQLSDFLRVRLQKLGTGVWLDTDLYLLRPMMIDRSIPYFAWESFSRIGNSVLYLPPAHPIVDLYEKLMAQDELVPEWITLRQRFKMFFRSRFKATFNPSDIKLAMFGPEALTVLARQSGALPHALPRRSFYAIHARLEKFFNPTNFHRLLADPGVIGLHVSPKWMETQLPAVGSLYEWAARNVDMEWQGGGSPSSRAMREAWKRRKHVPLANSSASAPTDR